METNYRFSILQLEKDVLDYVYYKNKYYIYVNKNKNKWSSFNILNIVNSKTNLEKEQYYYKLYISKMKKLEENYRKTNIYTKYHAQLENVPEALVIMDPSAPTYDELIFQ